MGTKKEFTIDLDNFIDEVFYEMEKVSDTGHGHECVIQATSAKEASEILAKRLTPFFEKQFTND